MTTIPAKRMRLRGLRGSVGLLVLMLGTLASASACGSAEPVSADPQAAPARDGSVLEARRTGIDFASDPLVVVDQIPGRDVFFTVYFRTTRVLPYGRCNSFCQQEGNGARVRAEVTLSGGGSDSDQSGITRLPARKGRYCWEQTVSDFKPDSPLARAKPGQAVTVALRIAKPKRVLRRRVELIAPLPPVYDQDGIQQIAVEYQRALRCGGS